MPAHSQSSFLNSSSGQKKRGAVLNAIFGQEPEQLLMFTLLIYIYSFEKKVVVLNLNERFSDPENIFFYGKSRQKYRKSLKETLRSCFFARLEVRVLFKGRSPLRAGLINENEKMGTASFSSQVPKWH